MPFAHVALPVPLRRTFVYRIPEALAAAVKPGVQVEVPFHGRARRGHVLEVVASLDAAATEKLGGAAIRDRTGIAESPAVSTHLLALAHWIADYYLAPIGEVIAAMLPGGLEGFAKSRARKGAEEDPIVRMPQGTGIALPGGPLLVQVHLGAGSGASATLELEHAAVVEDEVAFVPIAATHFALPPGQATVSWTETVPLAAPDLRVYGILPHLHTRGRSLSIRSPDTCLADAPRWDYRWQELASYTSPVTLRSGTPLTLTCTFSTLDATTTTVWGETGDDEMCMAFLLASR